MIEPFMYFPIALLFSTIAMTFGIGGAALFTPFFFLVAGLEPTVAVATGLFIEIFGFGSGLFGFVRKKLIAYKTGLRVLKWSIPAALVGVAFQRIIPQELIIIILTVLLVVLAMLISVPESRILLKHHTHHARAIREETYVINHPWHMRMWSMLGGFLASVVSTGIGEINDYLFLKKFKMKGSIAAATSVFVVALTVLVGSAAHALVLFKISPGLYETIGQIVLFAVPGVIIGAQIGVEFAQRIDDDFRRRFLTTMFSLLALVTASGLLRGA